MSAIADALALEETIEFKGLVYTIKPLTYYSLGKFSTWLEANACAFAERAKQFLSADSMKGLLRGIASDVACRLYEPGGAYFLKAEQSREGQMKLLELCLTGPDIGPELVAELWLEEGKREEALAKLAKLNSDPKALRGMLIPEKLN